MNYLERAREFFRNDHYATDATGIVIELKRPVTGILKSLSKSIRGTRTVLDR